MERKHAKVVESRGKLSCAAVDYIENRLAFMQNMARQEGYSTLRILIDFGNLLNSRNAGPVSALVDKIARTTRHKLGNCLVTDKPAFVSLSAFNISSLDQEMMRLLMKIPAKMLISSPNGSMAFWSNHLFSNSNIQFDLISKHSAEEVIKKI